MKLIPKRWFAWRHVVTIALFHNTYSGHIFKNHRVASKCVRINTLGFRSVLCCGCVALKASPSTTSISSWLTRIGKSTGEGFGMIVLLGGFVYPVLQSLLGGE